MGKTFKDRRKWDRKHDRDDLKEHKREPKRKQHRPIEDEDDVIEQDDYLDAIFKKLN
jgi:hypothetical protein